MSTYYASKINYLIEDFMTENYNFQEIKKKLIGKLTKGKTLLWNSLTQLTMKLQVISPDLDAIMKHYGEGTIKSHEFDAIVDKITDMVKSAIALMTGKMAFTINYYEVLRNAISIHHNEEFTQENEKHTQRIDTILMHFSAPLLEIKDMVAFLNLWNLGEFCFAKQVSLEFTALEKGRSKKRTLINKQLEKGKIVDSQQFLTPTDSGLVEHSCYQKILNTYMFPEGFHSKAEITLDLAQEEILPKKRRMVALQGRKARFHDMLSKYTPYEKYKEIVKENNIAGVYCSVRSTNDEILYLLIDIDVPSMFFTMFPRQVVWQLILNVVNALKKTVAQFRLPPFKISFSGNKGVHLLWAVSPNAILDYERHVNLPELSEGDIPGIGVLKKEKVSTINDGFKFTKRLLQSILLYTIYRGYISIPKEIIKKLRIFYPYQIFRLSKDSKNYLSILLDTSSQNKGVFRLFSPHPTSKRVSIPISDLEQNEVLEKYHSIQTVLEDAKIENVLERFDNDDIELFLQYPNYITRAHIRDLLRPDALYPTFEVLHRFGVMYAIERSGPSFGFWHRFYELKSFYNYCERFAFSYNNMREEGTEHFEREMEYIEAMGKKLQIKQIDNILPLLRLALTENRIPFPVVKAMLINLYYTEFFFDLKSNIFLRKNHENLLSLFSNELQFSNFLNQATHLFNIAADTIIRIVLGNDTHYSDHQIHTIQQFNDQSIALLELARTYLGDIRQNLKDPDKEEKLLYTVFFVSNLYFTTRDFLREFHNIGEEDWKRN
jgi:hypothetical protein